MKYVVLSFDDGRRDFYTRAFPILKKHNLQAVLNVIPTHTNDIVDIIDGAKSIRLHLNNAAESVCARATLRKEVLVLNGPFSA